VRLHQITHENVARFTSVPELHPLPSRGGGGPDLLANPTEWWCRVDVSILLGSWFWKTAEVGGGRGPLRMGVAR
jgi:hypothetical protein